MCGDSVDGTDEMATFILTFTIKDEYIFINIYDKIFKRWSHSSVWVFLTSSMSLLHFSHVCYELRWVRTGVFHWWTLQCHFISRLKSQINAFGYVIYLPWTVSRRIIRMDITSSSSSLLSSAFLVDIPPAFSFRLSPQTLGIGQA